MKRRLPLLLLPALALCLAVSCKSVPDPNTPSMTAPEMIQKAQDASDRNRYNLALQYYQAVLQYHPDDRENVCQSQYEIAFIHYKQKKYAEAAKEFNDLLAQYQGPNAELLPQAYSILSNIVMQEITAKTAPKVKSKKKK
jgi:outer membrane protein assembly factor BamD (BamD/ComL family)